MSPTLTHIALHVPNLDACIAFYSAFCGLRVVHEREAKGQRIVWMAENGREDEFVLVIMPGGYRREAAVDDYGHLGFALQSREAVDAVAEAGERAGCLLWSPREDAFPVGYYCGLSDPAGNAVEFSYGQPLGPGAKALG